MTQTLANIISTGEILRADGTAFLVGTRVLEIGAGACGALKTWLSGRVFVVADANTAAFWPGADKVLPADVKPEKRLAEELAAVDAQMFLAIGSGTLNDIVKYASFLADKPYAVLATAPSMNGYLSATASLIDGGKKESLKAHLPVALFADTDILRDAPLRLIQAGFGDSICRPTAQSDWLLSHLVKQTPYDDLPFRLQAEVEQRVTGNAAALKQRSPQAIADLMEWLLLAGLGMTYCGGSHPASQGEHAITHAMEMLYPELTAPHYHGEMIAVTTLTMAGMQEQVLNSGTLPEAIREKIRPVAFSASRIRSLLEQAGLATSPEALGWPPENYRAAIAKAPEYRERYGFLSMLTKC